MTQQLQPGQLLPEDPNGEVGLPGPVFVNAVYDQLPMSETTDQFNTLRGYKTMHQRTGAGEGIKVGVGDTGVDKTHLEGDLKGCIGKDFTNSRWGYYDRHSHGSHTTGHIGARGDGQGFIGLAPNAGLYHAKVLGDSGSGSSRGIANGVQWLADQGCKIVNLSLGGGFDSYSEGVYRELAQQGVLIFAAMGNSGFRGGGHPGTSRYTFGITAVDYNRRVASFSSRDKMAKYAGYGVNVLSLVTNGRLARMSGTSMACPDQAGVCANILSYMLKLGLPLPNSMEEYESIVKDSLEDLGNAGHDTSYGDGFIHLDDVLAKLDTMAPPQEPEPPTEPTPPEETGTLGMGIALSSSGLIVFANAGEDATLKVGNKTFNGKAIM